MDVGNRAISLRVRAMDLFSRTFSFSKRSVVLRVSEKHLWNGVCGVLMTSMDRF
jgi:hypothetical protein